MKFFYGFSVAELESLDVQRFESYWQAIDIIEAQAALNFFKVSTLPNRSKEIQTADLRNLENVAYPRHLYPRKSTSLQELDRMINGG